MFYAVDYQPVSDSEVIVWENGSEPQFITLTSGKEPGTRTGIFTPVTKRKKGKLASSISVTEFLSRLGPEDTIFTELGGQNDRFCMAAFRQKAKVERLPTWLIHDEQDRQRREEGRFGEQIDKPALILYRYAVEKPELFYPFREVEDLRYLEVRLLSRAYYTVQRKIRITIANRLRALQQDIELLGGIQHLPPIKEAIGQVLETLPVGEEVKLELDSELGTTVIFCKTLEGNLRKTLEAKLAEIPLYKEVFAPISGCGTIIAGYIIGTILDIRRFPSLPKLRAFAGYHLHQHNSGWQAPRRQKGERANWNPLLKQAVYYFTSCIDKQPPDNPWKARLETRYLYEIKKLLDAGREAGKQIPAEMTAEEFLKYVADKRAKARLAGRIAELPEPYKGIPALARRRAMRWLGQKFLEYIWTEWRRLEGLAEKD